MVGERAELVPVWLGISKGERGSREGERVETKVKITQGRSLCA